MTFLPLAVRAVSTPRQPGTAFNPLTRSGKPSGLCCCGCPRAMPPAITSPIARKAAAVSTSERFFFSVDMFSLHHEQSIFRVMKSVDIILNYGGAYVPYASKDNETVEKVSLGADFSRVTIRFCAKSAFRRNADDDGSATACGIALLLLPPEDQISEDHLLRLIDRYVDFSFVRERLKNFY